MSRSLHPLINRDPNKHYTVADALRTLQGPTRTVYDFIEAFGEENSIPPSLREISVGLGMPLSSLYYHVRKLDRLGLSQRRRGSNRAIVLAGGKFYVDQAEAIFPPLDTEETGKHDKHRSNGSTVDQ